MSKKIMVLVGIVMCVVISAGIFYWNINREIKGSPDDYVIEETETGKIVRNEKAGLTVRVPDGWEEKRVESFVEGSIIVQSSDIEGKEKNGIVRPPLSKGCGIETTVTYKDMNLEEIKENVKTSNWMLAPKFEEFEEIIINNQRALKNVLDSEASGPMMTIFISKSGKVHTFSLIWTPDEKEECVKEFNKFLETIVID